MVTASTAIGLGSLASGALGSGGGIGTRERRKARQELRKNAGIAAGYLRPYEETGREGLDRYVNALSPDSGIYNAFVRPSGSAIPDYMARGSVPTYSPMGGVPDYVSQGSVPTYQSRGDFQFNLEEDPIYQYQRDQALQAATRGLNASGHQISGNLATELARVAAGEAGRYQDNAFARQLGQSRENYGRGVTDYGIGLEADRERYGRGLTDYGVNLEADRERYGRGVTDFGLGMEVDRENYGRGVRDYNILADRSNQMYGRGLSEYALEADRNRDMYGRGQNYLSRLQGLGDMGAQSATGLSNIYGALGPSLAGVWQRTGDAKMANNQFRASSINNAIQGYLSNSLLNDYINPGYTRGNPHR